MTDTLYPNGRLLAIQIIDSDPIVPPLNTLFPNGQIMAVKLFGGGVGGDSFGTIAVSGQSDIVADAASDTLTIAAGANITLTTDALTDTLTIAATGGGGTPGGLSGELQFNNAGSFDGVDAAGSAGIGFLIPNTFGLGQQVYVGKFNVTSALSMQRINGSLGSETATLDGNVLGTINFGGYTGGATRLGAEITTTQDGAVGSFVPCNLVIGVFDDGTLGEWHWTFRKTGVLEAEFGFTAIEYILKLPTIDGEYSGITIAGIAGTALAFGDLIYLSVTDSRWELTDADSLTTCGAVMTGICVLAAAGDGSPTTILLQGLIRADANFPALTIGAPVYASTTTGDIQVAAPSTSNSIVQVVGYATGADEIYFNPSSTYLVVA